MIEAIFISACALISGLGIGGGSFFLIFYKNFLTIEQKEAQLYNVIMYIFVSIAAVIYTTFYKEKKEEKTKKNKEKIDLNYIKKNYISIIIGAILGSILVKYISGKILRKTFLIFISILSGYEIIICLKNIKKHKIKIDKKGE
ncbi:MAG: TSUP family transporter [Clostridia bacterium]